MLKQKKDNLDNVLKDNNNIPTLAILPCPFTPSQPNLIPNDAKQHNMDAIPNSLPDQPIITIHPTLPTNNEMMHGKNMIIMTQSKP